AQELLDPWRPILRRPREIAVSIETVRRSRDEFRPAARADEGFVHAPGERRPEVEVVLAVDPHLRYARIGPVARHRVHEMGLAAPGVRPARPAAAGEIHARDEALERAR